MNKRPLIVTILFTTALFFIGGVLLNLFLGIFSGLLWLALKFLIPLALVVWFVRLISGSSNQRRYY